jgi:hypothetical protein
MRHEDERKAKWPSVLWIGAILMGAAVMAVYEMRYEIKAAIIRRVMGDALEDFRNQATPCLRCAGKGWVRKHAVRPIIPSRELPAPKTINCPLCGGSGKAPSPWD